MKIQQHLERYKYRFKNMNNTFKIGIGISCPYGFDAVHVNQNNIYYGFTDVLLFIFIF